VRVEEFRGFISFNLDPKVRPLAELWGNLGTEIMHWAPDIEELTFVRRLTYDIRSNWKNVVYNSLECHYCPTAHQEFCTLIDEMDT